MKVFFRIKDFLYLTSFHVAFVTVINALIFYTLLNVQIKDTIPSLLILFFSTWLIYIYDRISDNYKSEPLTKRHKYHLNNQFLLQTIGISIFVLIVVLVFFIPKGLLVNGFGYLILIFGYLLLKQKSVKFETFKEIPLIIIYGIGVLIGPFTMAKSIYLSTWIIALMFLLVVMQNVLAYSWFEFKYEEQFGNLVNDKNEPFIRKIINLAGSLNIFILIIFFTGTLAFSTKYAFSLCLISVMISLCVAFSKKIKNDYRWIIDLLFLISLIVVI